MCLCCMKNPRAIVLGLMAGWQADKIVLNLATYTYIHIMQNIQLFRMFDKGTVLL